MTATEYAWFDALYPEVEVELPDDECDCPEGCICSPFACGCPRVEREREDAE